MEANRSDKERDQDKKKNPTAGKRTFTIREMEIEDLAEVYELGEQSFKADLWPMLYRSWDEYEVTTLFNTDGDYCLVAENDDFEDNPKEPRIVGFVLGTVIAKSGSAWNYGYVLWLCSHSDWAREGVAGKLVDKLVEIMVEQAGIRMVMADTDPENVRAVKFFNKKGFTTEKPHLYLTSNLEHNEQYGHLLKASRAAALEEEYLKKIRRIARASRFLSSLDKREKPAKAEKTAKADKAKKQGGKKVSKKKKKKD